MKNIVLTIAAFLLFSSAALGQGSVEGTVTDAKGAAIGYVSVSLIGPGGKVVAGVLTDADGYYVFDEVAAGTYKIVTVAKGFQAASKAGVAVADDDTATVDLTLAAEVQPAKVEQPAWPQPKFRFEIEYTVDGKTSKIEAQEVSGLDVEAQPIEYRAGNSPVFSVQTMPGIKKYSDITIKKGIFKSDNTFWDWYKQTKDSQRSQGTVVLKLLDDDGRPTMVWTLLNAWPTKITGNGANGFETLVLAHDGMKIANQ